MTDAGMGIAGDLAMILMAALVGGLIAHLLRLPLVLGYILAGIVVGPNTPGPTVGEFHNIEVLADIGVALLLFTVGLEFSPARLWPVRNIALLGTVLQIALCSAFGWGIGLWIGLPSTQALWLGCLISLSSTMVALKLLADQGQSQTLSGRVMLGMLVVQDLASIPMMIVLPSLGQEGGAGWGVTLAALKAMALVGLMLTFGARLLPTLLRFVLRSGSTELFLVTVGGVTMGVGYLSYFCGLSFALGAFLAGLVLSESDYSHHTLGIVGPFRDGFAMLFFVSVGMLVQPQFLWHHLRMVLFLLTVFTLGKGFILGLVGRVFGYRDIVPLALAFSLSQVGEFSFVLARVGAQSGTLDRELYDLMLILAVLSMGLTPVLMKLYPPIYNRWRRRHPALIPPTEEAETQVQDHIVIGGYGRVGRRVAQILERLNQPCLCCDLDVASFERAKSENIPCVFGDMSGEATLEALQLEKARQVILTFNDPVLLHLSIQKIHALRPELSIVVEANSREHLAELRELGVDQTVLPDLLVSMEFIRLALVSCGCDVQVSEETLQGVRAQDRSDLKESVEDHD